MKCLFILMLMASYALADGSMQNNNDEEDDVIMSMLKQLRQDVTELNAKTDFLQATVDYLRVTSDYLEATNRHLKVTVAELTGKVHDIEYDLSTKEQADYDKLQAGVTALNRNVEENCKNETMCCQQLRDEIEALTNNKTTTTTSSETTTAVHTTAAVPTTAVHTTTAPPTTTAVPTTAAACGPLNNGYNYEWVDTEYTWNDARTNCQSKGGDLAYHGLDTLNGREQLLCGYFNLCDNGDRDDGAPYIGLSRDTTTGMFKYLDGEDSPFDDQLWLSLGEYDQSGEDCGALLAIEYKDPYFLQAYSWPCDRYLYPSICEIPC